MNFEKFTKTAAQAMNDTASLAAEYGLYVTAGSDYHGENKLILPADTGLKYDAPFLDGLERFLNDLLA